MDGQGYAALCGTVSREYRELAAEIEGNPDHPKAAQLELVKDRALRFGALEHAIPRWAALVGQVEQLQAQVAERGSPS